MKSITIQKNRVHHCFSLINSVIAGLLLSFSFQAEALQITDLALAADSWYYNYTKGLAFLVEDENQIPVTGLTLRLNGQTVTAHIEITGPSNSKTFRYGGLTPNQVYDVEFIARNAVETQRLKFQLDTFFQDQQRIEMENWDFNSGQYYSGSEISRDGVIVYQANQGVAGNDFLDLRPDEGVFTYRNLGATRVPQTILANEPARVRATGEFSGRIDYCVGWIRDGEWLQYTRDFSPGVYEVYLRASGLPGVAMKLDQVVDHSEGFDGLKSLGWFSRSEPDSSQNNYQWLALKNFEGETRKLQLSGETKLRFTALRDGFHVNLCLFKQISSFPNVSDPKVVKALPFPGDKDVAPDESIQLTFYDPLLRVHTGSIEVSLDDIPGEFLITDRRTEQGELVINVTPETHFEFDSHHTVQVRVLMEASNDLKVSKEYDWSFKVLPEVKSPTRLLFPNPEMRIKTLFNEEESTFTFDYSPEPGLVHQLQWATDPQGLEWQDFLIVPSAGRKLQFKLNTDERDFLLFRILIQAPY